MNTINTDLTQATGATIALGTTDAETQALASAESTKIIGDPSVTVTETAFDSLLDKVMLEYQNTHERLNLSLLASAITSIAAQADITSQYQKELLDQSAKLIEELVKLSTQLQTADAKLKAAEKDLNAAKKALEDAKKADPKQDLSAYEEAVDDAQDAYDAAKADVDDLNKKISAKKTELEGTLAKLDDSSKRVLAAAVRVVATGDTSYLETLRNFRKEQSGNELPALEAFNRLLSGENLNDVLMQELGIKA